MSRLILQAVTTRADLSSRSARQRSSTVVRFLLPEQYPGTFVTIASPNLQVCQSFCLLEPSLRISHQRGFLGCTKRWLGKYGRGRGTELTHHLLTRLETPEFATLNLNHPASRTPLCVQNEMRTCTLLSSDHTFPGRLDYNRVGMLGRLRREIIYSGQFAIRCPSPPLAPD
ncbi:hypothetical protein BDV11DRAFT_185725 [Aspergillus similis]